MRKYFEGLSPVGVALIFVSIAFGTFLRLYDIDLVSYWSDELATVYFAKYPLKIYSKETHPFGFYLLMKPLIHLFGSDVYVLRLAVGLISVAFNLYLFTFAKKVFAPSAWVVFTIFLFLIPIDIAFARMARMYSLYFSLSTWFYLLVIKEPRSLKLPLLSFLMSCIFPVGFLAGGFYGLFLIVKDKKISRFAVWMVISVLPMCLYYLSKFLFLKSNPLTDYLAGDEKLRPLTVDFIYSMGGEYFPKSVFQVMPDSVFFTMVGLTVFAFIIGVYFRIKVKVWINSFDFGLGFFIFSFAFFKMFGLFVVNIEVGRYLIFLVPLIFLPYSGIVFKEKWRDVPGIVILFTLLFSLVNYSPFSVYDGEREAFTYFEELKKLHPGQQVVCGNKFQYDYYFNTPKRDCFNDMTNFQKEGKDFVFMDINGYGRHLVVPMMKTYDLFEHKSLYLSFVAWAKPKQTERK